VFKELRDGEKVVIGALCRRPFTVTRACKADRSVTTFL
jgi:hypothetical protein